jgi:hypothetical protein
MMSNRKEMSLDVALEYAQRNQIFTVKSNDEFLKGCHFAYHTYAVVVGRFAFQVHSHDTGNSVRGYILTEDKPYEIISATFWKCSGYEHNKDKWEKGAWDAKLEEAISGLKATVKYDKEKSEQLELERKAARELKELSEKSKVEALFS